METKTINTPALVKAIVDTMVSGDGDTLARLVASKGGAAAFGEANRLYTEALNTRISDSNKARRGFGRREHRALLAEAAMQAMEAMQARLVADGLSKGTLLEYWASCGTGSLTGSFEQNGRTYSIMLREDARQPSRSGLHRDEAIADRPDLVSLRETYLHKANAK